MHPRGSPVEEDGIQQINILFQECLSTHREAYPSSPIDFDRLNLNGRLSTERQVRAGGNFSDVYKAKLDGGDPVAIKSLRLPTYTSYTKHHYRSTLLRFFRELHHWSNLNHINIVPLIGFEVANGNISFVSSWYANGNLKDHLQEFPAASKPDLILDVLEGVQYLHEQLLVHGDLKAINVLVSNRGIARLTDFGISKHIDDFRRKTGFSTTSGAMGTIPWMAPELDCGEPLSFASDVYSCAGTCLEICCPGNFPYYYLKTPQAIISAKSRGELPHIDRYRNMGDHLQLWEQFTLCWCTDPQERPSVGVLIQSLYKILRLRPRVIQALNVRPSALCQPYKGQPGWRVVRQALFERIMKSEEQYIQDLDFIESTFVRPLREGTHSFMPTDQVEEFIGNVFGRLPSICNMSENLLRSLYICHQAQWPLILKSGDLFKDCASELSGVYMEYITRLPTAVEYFEKELNKRSDLRAFFTSRPHNSSSKDMTVPMALALPVVHLRNYVSLLDEAVTLTDPLDDDARSLLEADAVFQQVHKSIMLETFQGSLGGTSILPSWDALVSSKVLKQSNENDLQRQRGVHDLIKSEMQFVADLDMIQTHLIQPLQGDSCIIPKERLGPFMNAVYKELMIVHSHHRCLLQTFFRIQKEEHPYIHSIFSEFLLMMRTWKKDYKRFISNYPIASCIFEAEWFRNPAFKQQLLVSGPRLAGARRLASRPSTIKPLNRIYEYKRYFGAILNTIPETNNDRQVVVQIIDELNELISSTQPLVLKAERKVEIWRCVKKLCFTTYAQTYTDFLNKNRVLVHSTLILTLRKSTINTVPDLVQEAVLLVFDHVVVVGVPEGSHPSSRYLVNTRPIPLEFLDLAGFDGLSPLCSPVGDAALNQNLTDVTSPKIYPCELRHSLRPDINCTILLENVHRLKLKSILGQAAHARKVQVVKKFNLIHLSNGVTLVKSPIPVHGHAGQRLNRVPGPKCNRVLSVVHFGSILYGKFRLALGCFDGLWLSGKSPKSSKLSEPLQQIVLAKKNVSQCGWIEELGLLIAIADGSLYACNINKMNNVKEPGDISNCWIQPLSGGGNVASFSIGKIAGRTCLAYVGRKSNMSDSVISTFESIGERTRLGVAAFKLGNSLLFRNRPVWLQRSHPDLRVSSSCYGLTILNNQVIALFPDRITLFLMDVQPPLKLREFSNQKPPLNFHSGLYSHFRMVPLTVAPCDNGGYLLCFAELGLFTDRYWRLIGDTPIFWEGRAEQVVVYPPYILLFNENFIEIRNKEDGNLLQVIQGSGIRCLWDGGWKEGTSRPLSTIIVAMQKVDETAVATSLLIADSVAEPIFELRPASRISATETITAEASLARIQADPGFLHSLPVASTHQEGREGN